MTLAGLNASTLSRAARRFVYAAWALLALGLIGILVTSSDGISPGPTILFAAAALATALGALCGARAMDAQNLRSRLLWVGRALALLGAAVAIVFPAMLYGEIAMLAGQGRRPTYDIEAAMWHEFQLMPLVVVPAFVALRWARMGAALFVLSGVFNAIEMLYHPFGNFYPEAGGAGPFGVLVLDLLAQPAFITAALLIIGGRATPHPGHATAAKASPLSPG